MKNLLQVAINEIGVKEIKGTKHNKRILDYAKESGFSWVKDDETAWCSIFLNWVAKKAGLETTNSAAARSWLNVGMEVSNPEPGDIVVFWRESRYSSKGHVAIYLGFSKDHTRVYVLGGNQKDSVSISAYPVERVLSFRRLHAVGKIKLPKPILEKGDKGQKVVQLQNALKQLGYNPGTSDGRFGPKTELAVKELQTTGSYLDINGIYDFDTKDYMEALLNDK